MRMIRCWPVIGAAGVGLLGAPCVLLLGARPAPLPLLLPRGRAARCTPAVRALREAAYWRTQAAQYADDRCDEEREQLFRWDPRAPFAFDERRQQLLAADETGALRRAFQATACAAARAASPRERRQAERERAWLAADQSRS